jgi:hypothetical protein
MARAQVVGIAGDGGFQHFDRRGVVEQRREAQARTGADRPIVVGEVGGQGIEQLFGFVRGARLQQCRGRDRA